MTSHSASDQSIAILGNSYIMKRKIDRSFRHYCQRWHHQMETFSALLAISEGNSPVIGEFPAQRPVTRSLDVFFVLGLNERLSKQSWGWWFETPSRPLWRHSNREVTRPSGIDIITSSLSAVLATFLGMGLQVCGRKVCAKFMSIVSYHACISICRI